MLAFHAESSGSNPTDATVSEMISRFGVYFKPQNKIPARFTQPSQEMSTSTFGSWETSTSTEVVGVRPAPLPVKINRFNSPHATPSGITRQEVTLYV